MLALLQELVEGLQSPDPAVSLAALPGLVAAIPTCVWQPQMPQACLAVPLSFSAKTKAGSTLHP